MAPTLPAPIAYGMDTIWTSDIHYLERYMGARETGRPPSPISIEFLPHCLRITDPYEGTLVEAYPLTMEAHEVATRQGSMNTCQAWRLHVWRVAAPWYAEREGQSTVKLLTHVAEKGQPDRELFRLAALVRQADSPEPDDILFVPPVKKF